MRTIRKVVVGMAKRLKVTSRKMKEMREENESNTMLLEEHYRMVSGGGIVVVVVVVVVVVTEPENDVNCNV